MVNDVDWTEQNTYYGFKCTPPNITVLKKFVRCYLLFRTKKSWMASMEIFVAQD